MPTLHMQIPGKLDERGTSTQLSRPMDVLGGSWRKYRRRQESPPDYYGPNRVTFGVPQGIKNSYDRRTQGREEKIYLPLAEQPL